MKNATLTMTFPADRLDALTYHMERKEVNLQAELNDTMQKLYEKHVPQATREYIEDKMKRDAVAKDKPKRQAKSENTAEPSSGNLPGRMENGDFQGV